MALVFRRVLITTSGRVLTDEDLDRWADEAERGYDLTNWRPRRGRPFLDPAAREHSPRVSVRVPVGLRDRAAARAASEGHSMSEVLRSLLEQYAADFPGPMLRRPPGTLTDSVVRLPR